MQFRVIRYACAPSLVGIAYQVSEILVHGFKKCNQLKKFTQVEAVENMHVYQVWWAYPLQF